MISKQFKIRSPGNITHTTSFEDIIDFNNFQYIDDSYF